MEFEESEMRRTQYAIFIHLLTWAYLCYLRRKHFAIPKFLGFMVLNLFTLSLIYGQSYNLSANTLGDPNSKAIYASFLLSDCLFGFVYVLLKDYIYTSGFFAFSVFPKFFFAVSFNIFFDDRAALIWTFYLVTSLLSFFAGLTAEELLI
jgi:hypothetical protein